MTAGKFFKDLLPAGERHYCVRVVRVGMFGAV